MAAGKPSCRHERRLSIPCAGCARLQGMLTASGLCQGDVGFTGKQEMSSVFNTRAAGDKPPAGTYHVVRTEATCMFPCAVFHRQVAQVPLPKCALGPTCVNDFSFPEVHVCPSDEAKSLRLHSSVGPGGQTTVKTDAHCCGLFFRVWDCSSGVWRPSRKTTRKNAGM